MSPADITARMIAGDLAGGRIRTVFQPVVSARGEILFFELLTRWLRVFADGKTRGPDVLFERARQTGVSSILWDFTAHQACAQAQHLESKGLKLAVSFNASPSDLDDPDLCEGLLQHIERHALDPDRLIVEITEESVPFDDAKILPSLACMERYGMRFAIDDFGVNRSTIERAKSYPASIIKLDRGFVTDAARSAAGEIGLRETVRACHALGAMVVVEGIETAEDAKRAMKAGADGFQGYLFARPMHGANTIAWAQEFFARGTPALRSQYRQMLSKAVCESKSARPMH